jgi:type I restriction enzyme S subunit
LPVQRLIAGYLDREVGRLDGLVAAKQRWLALLAEKRRALITRAVTRGLDPKALLRDSGLPWLGQMPKHWRTMRLKFCCDSLQTGPFGSQLHAEDYVEDGIPVVNPAHMQAGRIVPDSAMAVDEATAQRLSIHRLQRGDIVFARRGELGRCGLVTEAEERWLCGTGSIRARPHLDIVQPEYLISVAAYTGFAELLSLESVGTTMENINTEIIGDMAIPVPPLDEQRAIVAHIASETTKLDGLREATERTVALLLERRAALIAAAVTGKIDLPETKCQIDAVARERRPQPCV